MRDEAELIKTWPGRSAAETQAKLDIFERVAMTRSWTEIAALQVEKVEAILEDLPKIIKDYMKEKEKKLKEAGKARGSAGKR